MTLKELFATLYNEAPVEIVDHDTEINGGIKSVEAWKENAIYILELSRKEVYKVDIMLDSIRNRAYILVLLKEEKVSSYKYIWAWHKFTGSRDYYIENLINKAKREGAPATAIYYDNMAKRWVCLEEACLATQANIKKFLEQNT